MREEPSVGSSVGEEPSEGGAKNGGGARYEGGFKCGGGRSQVWGREEPSMGGRSPGVREEE